MHLPAVLVFTIATLLRASPVHAVVIGPQPRSVNPNPLAVCALLSSTLSNSSAVFYPGSPDYATAIEHWVESSSETSLCAVEPATAEDVGNILRVLGSARLPFAVKGSGHILQPGFSSTSGIHIAMSRFNQVVYDPTPPSGYASFAPLGSVTIGMGLKWDDVYTALEPLNITVAGGRVEGVGVGGFTLGGGYSYHANQVGMSVDTILKYELVLASGSVQTVTAASDPDLFWALKGGGNNLGIVTRVTYKALPYHGVWGGVLSYDGSTKEDVFAAVLNYEATVTDPRANLLLAVVYFAGGPGIAVGFFYDAPTPPAGLFDELRAIPNAGVLGPHSMTSITAASTQDPFSGPRAQVHTVSVPKNNLEFLNAVWDQAVTHGASLASHGGISTFYTVEPLQRNFLVRSPRTSDSAYPPTASRTHSGQPMNIFFAWNSTAGDAAHRTALAATTATLQTLANSVDNCTVPQNLELYPNYAMAGTPLERLYGVDGLKRLRKVAKRVDPNRVMTLTGGWKV